MSSRPRPRAPRVQTLDTETAHERHARLWKVKQSYESGRKPTRPTSRRELDVLKERKRFIHATDVDPASLSWEDQLALKYYETLFREFCVVNLKHYKHGAIALRWRTEDEVMKGIAHLTCASMRCRYHEPPETEEEPDPESLEPLVPTTLTEFECPFSYAEEGEKKSALVKIVLCRECGKKLLHGRAKEKELKKEREAGTLKRSGSEGRELDEREGGEEDDFAPALPPEVEEGRRRSYQRASPHQSSARPRTSRSASPRRR